MESKDLLGALEFYSRNWWEVIYPNIFHPLSELYLKRESIPTFPYCVVIEAEPAKKKLALLNLGHTLIPWEIPISNIPRSMLHFQTLKVKTSWWGIMKHVLVSQAVKPENHWAISFLCLHSLLTHNHQQPSSPPHFYSPQSCAATHPSGPHSRPPAKGEHTKTRRSKRWPKPSQWAWSLRGWPHCTPYAWHLGKIEWMLSEWFLQPKNTYHDLWKDALRRRSRASAYTRKGNCLDPQEADGRAVFTWNPQITDC